MVRRRRLRAGRVTREIVTWTIGVLVVLGAWWVAHLVATHLGWSWP
jgi:hypothetical protein